MFEAPGFFNHTANLFRSSTWDSMRQLHALNEARSSDAKEVNRSLHDKLGGYYPLVQGFVAVGRDLARGK